MVGRAAGFGCVLAAEPWRDAGTGCKPAWDAEVPTQAWPAGSTWHRHCRELCVTAEAAEGLQEALQVPNTPGLLQEEGGMLLVAGFGVTGNKTQCVSAP